MDIKTILHKIKNDPYFKEFLVDKFDEKADKYHAQLVNTKELDNEQEELVLECLYAGADNMSLTREIDVYYSPYSLRYYATDEKKDEGIFWLEFESENEWGFYEDRSKVYEIFSEFENEHWDD